jgi:hypothetical protein
MYIFMYANHEDNFRSVFSLKIKIVMNRASLLQEREDWYLCETSSTWQRIQFCGKTIWFKFDGLVGGHRMKNQMTYIWFKLMHYKRIECDFFSQRKPWLMTYGLGNKLHCIICRNKHHNLTTSVHCNGWNHKVYIITHIYNGLQLFVREKPHPFVAGGSYFLVRLLDASER